MTGQIFVSCRQHGKTAAAAAAAGMSMDDYRARMRRAAWDTKVAVDRVVEEACTRDFPTIFPIGRPRTRPVLGIDVAEGVATWCALVLEADGTATIVADGSGPADPSWPEGSFVMSDQA